MLAVDSSVLYLVFKAQSHSDLWTQHLATLAETETLVICEVVYAELAPFFSSEQSLRQRLGNLYIEFASITPQSAYAAGKVFGEYRRRGGPRTAMIPDFLIAAHAEHQAGGLIATDRGYLRSFFPNLRVHGLAPSNGSNL